MKTCPFCAEEIQDAAIKCKHCGEFLEAKCAPPEQMRPAEPRPTAAKVERAPKPAAKEDVPQDVSGLYCAFCRSHNVPFRPGSDGSVQCPSCQRETTYSIRKVRTKKSKQQSQQNRIVSRELSIRIYGPLGEEELIEVMTTGEDLEAKSGDWLAFLSHQGSVSGIVNMTVGNRLDLAFPLQGQIVMLETQIAKLRPVPPASPQQQGCCLGCFMGVLGMFCFGSAEPAVGSVVGTSVLVLGVAMSAFAPQLIKPPAPDAAAQAKLDQIPAIQAQVDQLKRYLQ